MKARMEVVHTTKLTKENATEIFEEFQDQLIISVNALTLPRNYDLALQLSDHFMTNLIKPKLTDFRSSAYENAIDTVKSKAEIYEDKEHI